MACGGTVIYPLKRRVSFLLLKTVTVYLFRNVYFLKATYVINTTVQVMESGIRRAKIFLCL